MMESENEVPLNLDESKQGLIVTDSEEPEDGNRETTTEKDDSKCCGCVTIQISACSICVAIGCVLLIIGLGVFFGITTNCDSKHRLKVFCPSSEGEGCNLHTDCENYGASVNNIACCQGICTKKVQDAIDSGLGICPGVGLGEGCKLHEDCLNYGADFEDVACCNADGGDTRKGKGICKKKEKGLCPPAELGDPCDLHTDCRNWGPKFDDVACCHPDEKGGDKLIDQRGVCKHKIGNWCPGIVSLLGEECKLHEDCLDYGPGLTQTACCHPNSGDTTPGDSGICKSKIAGLCPGADIGNPCELHTDCQGWGPGFSDVACCHPDEKGGDKEDGQSGVCKAKIGNWCPGIVKLAGESCTLHEDCLDYGPGLTQMACCDPNIGDTKNGNGICKAKVAGLCPGASSGSSCTLHTDCLGWGAGNTMMACCDGVCKKKDGSFGIGKCPSSAQTAPVNINSPPNPINDGDKETWWDYLDSHRVTVGYVATMCFAAVCLISVFMNCYFVYQRKFNGKYEIVEVDENNQL